MDQDTSLTLNQNVDMLFTNLENFTQNEGVIGKPVVHENKTFLPIVSVTLGFGGGNSASKSQPDNSSNQAANTALGSITGKMAGGALGYGAKLNTEAVIVIDKDKDQVSMLSMTAGTQITEKIPQMISNMMGGQQGTSQGQSQSQGSSQGQSQGGSQGMGQGTSQGGGSSF